MKNKPYHIIVWDTLNEVFGRQWEIDDTAETGCHYDYVNVALKMITDDYYYIDLCIYIYWESGGIHFIHGDSSVEDANGNYIEWDLYIWDNKFKTVNPDYGYDEFPTFNNLETFKQFLEYNKKRFFYNEHK